MKKLLAIAGSPRRGGNTDLLLEEILRAARTSGVDTERLVISELKVSPCTACGGCWNIGECVQKDDMQWVYQKLLEADYIVVTSPLYFLGVSAQLKALIDRCQAIWARRYVLGMTLRNGRERPKGLFLSVAGVDRGDRVFLGAVTTVKAFFHVLDVEYKGELLFYGLEERGAVSDRPDLLKKAYKAGKGLIGP